MEDLKKQPLTTHLPILERCYPQGLGTFFRQYEDDFFSFQLKAHAGVISKVVLTLQGQTQKAFSFTRRPKGPWDIFTLTLKAPSPGVYDLAIKYLERKYSAGWATSIDQTGKLIVDPKGARGIRLYTFIPSVSGKISHWIKEIKRLKKMGFNAIHLLPITKMGSSQSPYSAYDLFAIDPLYADNPRKITQEFSLFVKECKKLKIKLCLDLVFNHVAFDSKIRIHHPQWAVRDPTEKDHLKRAGWKDHLGVWHPWGDLILLNYRHKNPLIRKKIWQTMEKYAFFWARFAAQTEGMIRLDNLHSSDFSFLKAVLPKIQKKFPQLTFFGEFFANSQEQKERWSQALPLHLFLSTPWDNAHPGPTREHLLYVHRVFHQYRYLTPLTSHDSATPVQVYGATQTTLPRYVLYALLTPGLTGVTQGVEWGNQEQINFIGGHNHWQKNLTPGIDFQKKFRKINSLASRYPFFSQAGNILFVDKSHPFIIAGLRFNPRKKEQAFLIAANLDTLRAQKLAVDIKKLSPFKIKTLEDVFSREIFPVPDSKFLSLKLPPNGFLILRAKTV